MHRLILFFMMLSAAMALDLPVNAAGAPLETVEHIVQPELPKDFTLKRQSGSYLTFTREYGLHYESNNEWSKKIIISFSVQSRTAITKEKYWAQHLSDLRHACPKLVQEETTTISAELHSVVYCPTDQGKGQLSSYRIVDTDSGVFAMRYIWRLDSNILKDRFQRLSYGVEGAAALNKIKICNFAAARPCLGIDFDLVDGKAVALGQTPACRSKANSPCKPAIIVTAVARDITPEKIANAEQSGATLLIDFTVHDITSLEAAQAVTKGVMERIQAGAPSVLIALRAADPDYPISKTERIKAGSFMLALYHYLLGLDSLDPNSVQMRFINFRPAARE